MNFSYNQTISLDSVNSNDLIVMFSHDELIFFRIICRILCGVSVAGLLCVFILFWFFKNIRSYALELVIYLCFSSIVFNISYFLPVDDEDYSSNISSSGQLIASCVAQGVLSTFGDLSSMLWTTIIGYTAFISVVIKDELEQNKNKYRIAFLSVAFGVPLLFSMM
jgi:hypothetical protein